MLNPETKKIKKIILAGLFASVPLVAMAAQTIEITDGNTSFSCLQNGIEVYGDGTSKVTLSDLSCLATSGSSTGGSSTGGSSTGGSSTGGSSTGGSSTGGSSTGGGEILTAAFESVIDFNNAWQNTFVGDGTVHRRSTNTKANLISLIDTSEDGYQLINPNGTQKEVFIINKSRDATTIIPACTNGKDFSFSNSLCEQVNMPFKRNEIYALRGKTKAGTTYSGTAVTKDFGQLYLPRTENYNVSVSKYPGDLSVGSARKTDDFTGAGCTTTTTFNWFYIGLKPQGVPASYECVVPPGSNFYVNVELQDERSRAVCDQAFCQFDIKLSGVQNPLP